MTDKESKRFVIAYTIYMVSIGMLVGFLVYGATDVTTDNDIDDGVTLSESIETVNPQLTISGGELQPAAKVENINWNEVRSWR